MFKRIFFVLANKLIPGIYLNLSDDPDDEVHGDECPIKLKQMGLNCSVVCVVKRSIGPRPGVIPGLLLFLMT